MSTKNEVKSVSVYLSENGGFDYTTIPNILPFTLKKT